MIRKADVAVAKNYLDEDEIRELNRMVTMYPDYAEDQARHHTPMHMADWIKKLDAFLRFNEKYPDVCRKNFTGNGRRTWAHRI